MISVFPCLTNLSSFIYLLCFLISPLNPHPSNEFQSINLGFAVISLYVFICHLAFNLLLTHKHFANCRSATGENWHKIMLACTAPAKCDTSIKGKTEDMTCGSNFAIAYFISFIFFCSFLVSTFTMHRVKDSYHDDANSFVF